MISFDNGRAIFGGVDLHRLCARERPPLFVYHLETIKARVASLRAAFGDEVQLLYAVKANPHPELLSALCGVVDGLDISSVGELERALAAGYSAASLSFTGPAKGQGSLARALEAGVGVFCVESIEELTMLAALARDRGLTPGVRLRINPPEPIHAYGLSVGGGPSPFGVDVEQLPEAAQTLRQHRDALRFVGTHHFVGSQCLSARALIRHVEQSLAIARQLEQEAGLAVSSINLGGGFGVPGPGKDPLDVGLLARDCGARFSAWQERTGRKPAIVWELGRYLVGPAGLYLCRVERIKASRGERFVIVDGGIHHLLAASGLYSASHPLLSVFNLDNASAEPQRVQLVGKLCAPFDRLGRDVLLPCPRVGDLLALGPAGAYGPTASPGAFLGHPPARERCC